MDPRPRIDRLRALAVLRHLPDARLEELTRVLTVRTVPAETVLFEEGSPGDTLFLLAEGRVRIEKRVAVGGAQRLALLGPGDVFGEMAVIEGAPRSARAVAHTDATLLALERPALEAWLAAAPVTAVGLFAELLRVFSQRLRRASQEIVLLYDLGHLALERFEEAERFLGAVLDRLIPHLDGEWSGAAYLYNEFNAEVGRVATAGARAEALPGTLGEAEAATRWLDATTLLLALPGRGGRPLGFLALRGGAAMGERERADLEVALTAVAHLVASALQNIQHETEERLRARLQRQQTFGASW